MKRALPRARSPPGLRRSLGGRGLRGNAPLPLDEFVHSLQGNARALCEDRLGQLQWHQKLTEQDLSRMQAAASSILTFGDDPPPPTDDVFKKAYDECMTKVPKGPLEP